ncbi:hypothetical protein FRACYDRAFT_246763 [Fragilariopsis cylindrus CCMP1102]|uniref:Uncharacterized protein n=1 Tax=Fragilariopsis cylindrus CCMP1102 TaxID=635003 RepID=A0A1E7EYD8_9STRA|nr:hypothetical protein FRACYDRAFT_246763 [Fragilariopsis cylindrus CCMP1102]|eukprot:OEU10887.1 hypothetical protein FRACYDRAFT_246763 [Fragilariopsis cylindrus CCMP1102]
MPPPPMSKEIFSIGAYIRVDPCSTSKGGFGYVTAVESEVFVFVFCIYYNGKYTMPRTEANLRRKKGDMYFKNMEIRGSDEGDAKNPAFALKRFWEEEVLPALDALAQQLTHLYPGKKIVFLNHWDNAPPHVEGVFIDWLTDQLATRGWVNTPQPAQSPLLNIFDTALFAAMSKHVLAKQGLFNHSLYLKKERLWEILQAVWKEYDLAKIANMHIHHHQMVNAVIAWKGGDGFATASRALHCGVRKVVVPVFRDEECTEACGVEVIESLNEVGGLDSLRYPTPDVMAEFKRDGELLPAHEYNPQKLLPNDIYELLVQQGSVNHPDYEYFTGGIDDEFDQIWEADEEQRRQVAQFEAWYWELD